MPGADGHPLPITDATVTVRYSPCAAGLVTPFVGPLQRCLVMGRAGLEEACRSSRVTDCNGARSVRGQRGASCPS